MCSSRCARDRDCEHVDVEDCMTRCEHGLSPRSIYFREDWVEAVQACAQRQTCVPDTDRAIASCINDARRRVQPSAAAVRFCKTLISRQTTCSVRVSRYYDYDHCIEWHELYTDAILDKMTDCEEAPCRVHGACFDALVGEDSVDDDPNVITQRTQGRILDAGSPDVTMEGHVRTESKAPVEGAKVCLHGSQGTPDVCVAADGSGAFSLVVPAHGESIVTVSAEGFAPRLYAITTIGKSLTNWSMTLETAAFAASRYAKLALPGPDATSGAILATAQAPAGNAHGLEGVAISIDPPSKLGTIYFGPDGSPDMTRTVTSTFSSGLLPGVAPAVVELTMGPADVSCVPGFGGWPSRRPGSVRVPVVAGFETRVSMKCHR
jgi:hypothetical protein